MPRVNRRIPVSNAGDYIPELRIGPMATSVVTFFFAKYHSLRRARYTPQKSRNFALQKAVVAVGRHLYQNVLFLQRLVVPPRAPPLRRSG